MDSVIFPGLFWFDKKGKSSEYQEQTIFLRKTEEGFKIAQDRESHSSQVFKTIKKRLAQKVRNRTLQDPLLSSFLRVSSKSGTAFESF
jgi:hypothetical protein